MFEIFLCVGYTRRILNYSERIIQSNATHIMSMTNHVAIGVETLRIDNGNSLKNEFIELIFMNL